jgi:hypothetical protein
VAAEPGSSSEPTSTLPPFVPPENTPPPDPAYTVLLPARIISEACATAGPVLVAMPELASRRERQLQASFFEAGHARPLRDDLSPWPRTPLDEAGRVAAEVIRRFPLD